MIKYHNAYLVREVRDKRSFTVAETGRYLGKHPNTIRKMADRGILKVRSEADLSGRKHRRFFVEDLDIYLDSLPLWGEDSSGEEPGSSGKESNNGHL